MLVFVIIGAVLLPVLVGMILALISYQADRVVAINKLEIENPNKGSGINPARTLGFEISANADRDTQYREARKLAAAKAARTPRGANMGVGRLGHSNLKTAFDGVKEDPITAVKIGTTVSWDAARLGMSAEGTAVAQPQAAAAATGGKIQLVPGKDYEYIEITDSMAPAEKRKARIANSKAKSAAMKAAKAAGVTPTAVPTTAAAPAAAAQPQQAATISVDVEPPQLVNITDDMDPADVRKARISNTKALSAFKKAVKAAGVDPSNVEVVDGKVVVKGGMPEMAAPAAEAAAPAAAAPAAAPAAPAAPDPANLPPKPDLIEITDDMDPADVRKARISNSKARSAYKKQLKAMGIDPKTVDI